MPKINRPRFGSLQFYPRKRVRKFLPRVNWVPVYDNVKEDGVLGVIGYKVGMSTAIVKEVISRRSLSTARASLAFIIICL